MLEKNWLDYWNKKNIWTESSLWKKNNDIFFNKTSNIFNYNSQHVVLDIGCGNGDFAEKISTKVSQVYCLDTSQEYINICKSRFAHKENIKVLKIDEDYTNLSFIKDIKFSIIIANSVIQYYKSQNEVIELVKSIKKISLKDAQFLIADIEILGSKKSSILKLIFNSIKNRFFLSLIKTGIKLITNKEYYKTVKRQPLLIIDIQKLIDDLSHIVKEVRVVDDEITVSVNRKHLLIKI